MKITTRLPGQLSECDLAHWASLQCSNPELHSPFFHPTYTCEAAKFFPGVEVAILEEDGEPRGYFPFQRVGGGRGIPVGGTLNDFQGVIAAPGFTFDAVELLRACRLNDFRFSQLVASQQAFQSYHWLTADSPSMDLREGFDVYAKRRREEGSTLISRTRDKVKAAKRDVGPLRFEPVAADSTVIETLIAWKSKQYERISASNHLMQRGALGFLKTLLARRDGDLQGVLSALYFGDHLAAVHLGMRSRDVLHLWFPTYNEELGKYSPGNIFFVEQAKAAESMGIRRIDFGTGNEKFKTSFRSFGTQVAEGAVGLGALASTMRRTWIYTKQWLQESRFHGPARKFYRGLRSFFVHGAQHDSN